MTPQQSNDILIATEVINLFLEAALVLVLRHERTSYLEKRRSIEERVALNIERTDLTHITQPVYALDKLLESIADLIDRVREPELYKNIRAGNEILIVGSPQGGKKALAFEIARLAGIHSAITVYNPRDPETLIHAKKLIEKKPKLIERNWRLVSRSVTRRPTELLLLPGLNDVNIITGEAWHDQLEALIEAASNLPHVLVIGTTDKYTPTGSVASWFGTVLEIPSEHSGEPSSTQGQLNLPSTSTGRGEWEEMIGKIAQGYLDSALKENYILKETSVKSFIKKILKVRPSPAEIQDIFAHLMTLAVYMKKTQKETDLVFTDTSLKTAIRRVIRPANTNTL